MTQDTILNKWNRYCSAQGMQKEAQAARLGIHPHDFTAMMKGKLRWDNVTLDKMYLIMEGRDILDRAVLQTSLFKEVGRHVQMCLSDKIMVTLAAPTGQGKTISAKSIAHKFGLKYYHTPADLQKKKVASIRRLVHDLHQAYNFKIRNINVTLRYLINEMQSDTRSVLIIDEAQRLISEDFGYLKVLQDLLDEVPSLSIMLLGNYWLYTDMFTTAGTTYQGISEQEQFLRRMSTVQKLPRLQKSDVKLWCDYNNIKLKPTDYNHLSEYFSHRAGLADLENVRKEIIRIMGRGKIKSWHNVDAGTMIAIYKGLHTEIKEFEEGTYAEESLSTSAKVA